MLRGGTQGVPEEMKRNGTKGESWGVELGRHGHC